jgi:DnaK suppressor protein
MITPLETNIIRQKLDAERASVLAQIQQHEARLSTLSGAVPDHLDLAQEYVARGRRVTLLAQAQQQLENIQAAVQRLEEGTYGLCAACGEPIPPARLEALPYACLCVRCQAQQEHSALPAQSASARRLPWRVISRRSGVMAAAQRSSGHR